MDARPPNDFLVLIRRAWPAVACFVVTFTLTFAVAIHEKITGDEQLFLGGAGMMARGDGLIYRDFLYNHMPTHALVLAGLFRLTSWWTLAARTLDATWAATIATMLFESARHAASRGPVAWRAAIAAGVVAIFLLNPITADAVGKAWNHDLAAMACLAGFLLLAHGLARPRPMAWTIAAGAGAAIAATSRLTFAPILAAFPLLILLAPIAERRFVARLRLLALWTLGALVAAAPAIWVWSRAPDAAYFGNFRFNAYSAQYHAKDTIAERLLLSTKFDFAWQRVNGSPSLALFVALAIVAAVVACWRPRAALATIGRARLSCLIGIVAVASATMFVPSPMYQQYLYGPLPFAALLIAWAAARVDLAARPWLRVGFCAIALTCVGFGARDYVGVTVLATPSSWTPVRAHNDALRLAATAPPGRILTFQPGFAMEGGRPIYPSLAIGRYGARIADLMKPKMRLRYHVPDDATIARWFDRDPPGALLLSRPLTPQEADLAALATAHGYHAERFDRNRDVFLPTTRPH